MRMYSMANVELTIYVVISDQLRIFHSVHYLFDFSILFFANSLNGTLDPGIIVNRCRIFYRYSMVRARNSRNWHAFAVEIHCQT